jgi:hypothetical protein
VICRLDQLVALMHQCEADTRKIIGKPAANMLSHWQGHQNDLESLVDFIRKRIRGDTKINGWKLRQSLKLSLEEIVAERCPDLFSGEDVRIARETLGLPPT